MQSRQKAEGRSAPLLGTDGSEERNTSAPKLGVTTRRDRTELFECSVDGSLCLEAKHFCPRPLPSADGLPAVAHGTQQLAAA